MDQVCDKFTIRDELNHLRTSFLANGYPVQVVSRGYGPKSPWIQSQPNANTTDKPKVLYLPYIQHIAEPIQRVCRQPGVKIVFRTAQTLRQQLVKVKNLRPELLMKNVIYEVPCQDCY